MKRMITVALTAAVFAASTVAQAADLTPRQVTKIVKRVLRAEFGTLEPPPPPPVGDNSPDHAITADHAEYADDAEHARRADHATTAGQANTAGHATTAGGAATADHATTATSATTAETAEVAGIAESANPMAYALIDRNGVVDGSRSSGISRSDVVFRAHAGLYCFFGPMPKSVQVTGIDEPPHAPPVLSARLGRHQNCPEGIAFYVRASEGAGASASAFFLSLVL